MTTQTALFAASTLHGWKPQVGDLVRAQWYSPKFPEKGQPLSERHPVGEPELHFVTGVDVEFRPGVDRWRMRKPKHYGYDVFEVAGHSNWCVLELTEEVGT